MKTFVLLITLVLPLAALGEALEFVDAWARATPPGVTTAAVYGRLANRSSAPIEITGAASKLAGKAHLHSTGMEAGMMRMRMKDRLTLAPGEAVLLAPGGLHIMLMGLERPLSAGDEFGIEVMTAGGETVRAQVKVGTISQMAPPP